MSAAIPATRMSARQVLSHLRRHGMTVGLSGEMISVAPRSRITPTMRCHILANRGGLLKLLAIEQGVLKAPREVSFMHERATQPGIAAALKGGNG